MFSKKGLLLGSVVMLILFTGAMSRFGMRNVHYDIPRLYIKGDISDMQDKADVRKITVEYRDNTRKFTAYAKLKVQGSSSLAYEKKNYSIKLYSDKKHTISQDVDFGWGEHNKYCLKANWIDKTHARNIVTARLAAEIQEKYGIMDDAPNHGLTDGFPIEIYSNEDFLGLYTLNIPKDVWMFNMDENDPNHLVFVGDEWGPETAWEVQPNYDAWKLETGEASAENLDKLTRVVDFVIKSTDEEFKTHFEEYLSLDATLNYMVLCDVALMPDNVRKNLLLVSCNGDYWYPNLYDLDASWGAECSGWELYDYERGFITEANNLFHRVRINFTQEYIQRYFELRESVLSQEHIMQSFLAFQEQLPQKTLWKEEAHWGNIPGFEYDQIEDFLNIHLPHLDAMVSELLN